MFWREIFSFFWYLKIKERRILDNEIVNGYFVPVLLIGWGCFYSSAQILKQDMRFDWTIVNVDCERAFFMGIIVLWWRNPVSIANKGVGDLIEFFLRKGVILWCSFASHWFITLFSWSGHSRKRCFLYASFPCASPRGLMQLCLVIVGSMFPLLSSSFDEFQPNGIYGDDPNVELFLIRAAWVYGDYNK